MSDPVPPNLAEPADLADLAARVRMALEAADLASFRDLLDPDVTWGAPGASRPSCRNRDQVLAWYQRGQERGVRAQVSDVSVLGDRLLVSLLVGGTPTAEDRGGSALRWQVLTVHDGLIVDIVGFDDRFDALAHAGVQAH
jgi:ketosteroid isomerase-like protein